MTAQERKELQFLTSPEFNRRRQQYVEVMTIHKLDGSLVPVSVLLGDGRRFDVEMIHDPVSATLRDEEGRITIYQIRPAVRQAETGQAGQQTPSGETSYLFSCANRWYVLMKT